MKKLKGQKKKSLKYDGYTFKSDLELSIYQQCVRKGLWTQYEEIVLNYTIPESSHKYTNDFPFIKKGTKDEGIMIECKGGGPLYGLTEETKRKMLLIKNQYPKIDIRFVFENAYLITGQGRGKPKVTYGEWAEIHGFKWSHKEIPDNWINDIKDMYRGQYSCE